MNSRMRTFILACTAVFLSACGGGGSESAVSPPPPPPPPPVDTDLDWDQGNWDEENWQ